MKAKKVILTSLIVIMALWFVGCATPGSTRNYFHPAKSYNVINEKYVDTVPSVVWDSLVRELSKSYFMINNIDKESRIINISFSTDNVSDYVDCGAAEVRVKRSGLDKSVQEKYEHNICSSNSYKAESGAMNQGGVMAPIIAEIVRKPSLNGRMNLYVAPQGNGTLVTVNCRYVVTINLRGTFKHYAPIGQLVNISRDSKSYTCSLDTKRPTPCTTPYGNGTSFICHSTGRLEKEILSLVN